MVVNEMIIFKHYRPELENTSLKGVGMGLGGWG